MSATIERVARLKEKDKVPAENAGAGDPRAQDMLLWPLTATKLALDAYLQWASGGIAAASRPQDDTPLAWTTSNAVALELSSMCVRDFSRGAAGGQPVLICAPYTLHSALMTDFAPGHSLVETLQQAGLARTYVTDWRSAESAMRYLSIDSFLADLNVAIDEIGAPVDLVGLCQGGWLSLIYAARFPDKVRRLVLAGTPVDISVKSDLADAVAKLPKATFERMVDRESGLVSGKHMQRTWSPRLASHEVQAALQEEFAEGGADQRALLDRFARWENATFDLPGTYYLQATDWIFRENRIAEGRFVALGHTIDLRKVRTPVFLLAGETDAIVPPDQAFATARLLGTPKASLECAIEPCTHLGLFMGRKSLGNSWRRIARWLEADIGDGGQPATASAA